MSSDADRRSPGFVGRTRALNRMDGALDRATAGAASLVLVSGEAGIGKTTIVRQLVGGGVDRGLTTVWGTGWHSAQAPAFWPWIEVVRSLGTGDDGLVGDLGAAERRHLARLLPEIAPDGAADGADPERTSDQERFELFGAVSALIDGAARRRPLIVVLDDLHWADPSSWELFEFVARRSRSVPLLVVGAYRHDEIEAGSVGARVLGGLSGAAESVRLTGLEPAEVAALVEYVAGADEAGRWAAEVGRRSGGHPFFVRELAHLLGDTETTPEDGLVPDAVREVIERRLARLDPACADLLRAAAVGGNQLLPDVLSAVCERAPQHVAELIREATRAGVLVTQTSGGTRFAHDLFRETIYSDLEVADRLELHLRTGSALEDRHARGATTFTGELARHFAAAIPLDGPDRALSWALAAARADEHSLAFAEAAEHLARVRRAIDDVGVAVEPGTLVDLLVAEAGDRARGGDVAAARELLDRARSLARSAGDPDRLAAAALGLQQLGARYGMPRTDVTDLLDEATTLLSGSGSALEARVAAALARELTHSVLTERARAVPLSEHALAVARQAGDASTLASCLLARHDVVWGPGTAAERVELTEEIVDLAVRAADRERHADGVLLHATALLASGSPRFRPELAEFLRLAGSLQQPRYDYLVLTRRATLALLDGHLRDAERLIETAAAQGRRIDEPDADNVRMSQRIGLLWARGTPDELADFAAQTRDWWVGLPLFGHAFAAAFLARAGATDEARRALDLALALGDWRSDVSFMAPAAMLASAAARLGDRDLSAVMHDHLRPMADECGLIAACVCFTGSFAHWAGVAAAACGRNEEARAHLKAALATHVRLGARAWEAETLSELAALPGPDAGHGSRAQALAAELGLPLAVTPSEPPAPAVVAPAVEAPPPAETPDGPVTATLRRDGEMWEVRFGDDHAHVRDSKGVRDLATLVERPGVDVHVLDLAGQGAPREGASADVLDAQARAEYRARLVELEQDRQDAADAHDEARLLRLDAEQEALMTELRTAAGLGGRGRSLGGDSAERARKAVTARVREAIKRIEGAVPSLGEHLDRSVVTGTTCRYQPTEPVRWVSR